MPEENKGPENIEIVKANPNIPEEKPAIAEQEEKGIAPKEAEPPEEIKTEPSKEVKAQPAVPKFAMPKIKIPKIKLRELPAKIMYTLHEYKRVTTVSKKPGLDELSKISKVAGAGIILIGFIGFIIQIIFQLIKW